ncbi:MAG: hypothetical protein ACLU8W_09780 [Clostridia bacterium]
MESEIIVAVLSLVGTLGGSCLGVVASSKLTHYRLKQLENKVDKHNQVVERVFKLEETMASMKHRMTDAENELKEMRK